MKEANVIKLKFTVAENYNDNTLTHCEEVSLHAKREKTQTTPSSRERICTITLDCNSFCFPLLAFFFLAPIQGSELDFRLLFTIKKTLKTLPV